jgi:hypothetical protein
VVTALGPTQIAGEAGDPAAPDSRESPDSLRPYLWALAADGEDGARSVLRLLREELALTMALRGRPTFAAIDR